jgi:hypothetical protein
MVRRERGERERERRRLELPVVKMDIVLRREVTPKKGAYRKIHNSRTVSVEHSQPQSLLPTQAFTTGNCTKLILPHALGP